MQNFDAKVPIGSLNGQVIPEHEMLLPVTDLGFVHGAAVVETLRTFKHELFRPGDHWQRLAGSVEVLGIRPESIINMIEQHALQLVQHNSRIIANEDELGLIVFVTAGPNPGYLGRLNLDQRQPTIGLHTFRLPFELWANEWREGQALCVSQVSAMPDNILPPFMKYRSRLHWFLADREVASRQPGSRAILVDEHGYLTETSSGNLMIVKSGKLLTPLRQNTLAGISQLHVVDIARELGIECREANISMDDVINADEAFVTSTSWCIMPVRSLNNQPVQAGIIWKKLLVHWSEQVGVDIEQQILAQCAI